MDSISFESIEDAGTEAQAINQALQCLHEAKPLGLCPLEGGPLWPEAYPYMLATAFERAAGQAMIGGHAWAHQRLREAADQHWLAFWKLYRERMPA